MQAALGLMDVLAQKPAQDQQMQASTGLNVNALTTPALQSMTLKRRWCGKPRKDICSRSPALRTGLVQQPVQIVASHDLTLFVRRLLAKLCHRDAR